MTNTGALDLLLDATPLEGARAYHRFLGPVGGRLSSRQQISPHPMAREPSGHQETSRQRREQGSTHTSPPATNRPA
jgi:hypothetical protein